MIHGWSGNPGNSFLPWLKKNLEERGYAVTALLMPEPDRPRIETWVPFISKAIGNPDPDTLLVGHSIGCQAIMRYLAELPEGVTVGTILLVGGWISKQTDRYTPEKLAIAKPWIETPINFARIRRVAPRVIGVFSDNDPHVTMDNVEIFKDTLGAETIVKQGQGHFSDADGVTTIPELLPYL